MATTGNLTTSAYKNRSITFSWSETSQSIADNTTTISWTLKGSGSASGYYKTQNITLKLDGKTVFQHLKAENGQINLYNGTSIASGTYTFKHAADGSKNFAVYLEAGIYVWAPNCSGSKTFTLDTIPRQATITSAPNFTDEDNPVVKYSNPAGNAVSSLQICITLDGNQADIAYRDVSKTGTSYTFNLTDAERNVLRNATTTANSRSVRFYLKTVIGGNTFYSKVTKTLSIVNCAPTLSPTVTDTGSVSAVLTGDANKIIKGFNSVTVAFGAAALKGATITSRKVTCGSKSRTSDGELYHVDSNVFKFTVTDSRGNTTSQTVTKTLVNYTKLTCNVTEEKFTADGVISFDIEGNFWNGNFGAVQNELTLKYAVYEKGGSAEWITVTPTFSDNTYSTSIEISGLDYKKKYVIVAQASDKAYSLGNTPDKIMICVPVFDWGEEDFNFNVPVYMSGVELDYIVEQDEKDGWAYRKWNSGKAECWKILEFSTTINTAFGSMYCGNATERQTYPFVFAEKPVETVTLQGGSTQGILYCEGSGHGVNGTNSSARYNVFRPGAITTSSTFYLSFYVCGRWK